MFFHSVVLWRVDHSSLEAASFVIGELEAHLVGSPCNRHLIVQEAVDPIQLIKTVIDELALVLVEVQIVVVLSSHSKHLVFHELDETLLVCLRRNSRDGVDLLGHGKPLELPLSPFGEVPALQEVDDRDVVNHMLELAELTFTFSDGFALSHHVPFVEARRQHHTSRVLSRPSFERSVLDLVVAVELVSRANGGIPNITAHSWLSMPQLHGGTCRLPRALARSHLTGLVWRLNHLFDPEQD